MSGTTTNGIKPILPNANAVLVLGILSVLFNCLIVGFILGIVGLVLSKESRAAYYSDPDKYSGYGVMNAGRVLSIIGVVLGSITLLYVIFGLIVGGTLLGILTRFVPW